MESVLLAVKTGVKVLSCGFLHFPFFFPSRTGPPPSPPATDKEENPAVLAENCFRELLGRATFGNMNNAVRPVFA